MSYKLVTSKLSGHDLYVLCESMSKNLVMAAVVIDGYRSPYTLVKKNCIDFTSVTKVSKITPDPHEPVKKDAAWQVLMKDVINPTHIETWVVDYLIRDDLPGSIESEVFKSIVLDELWDVDDDALPVYDGLVYRHLVTKQLCLVHGRAKNRSNCGLLLEYKMEPTAVQARHLVPVFTGNLEIAYLPGEYKNTIVNPDQPKPYDRKAAWQEQYILTRELDSLSGAQPWFADVLPLGIKRAIRKYFVEKIKAASP